MIVKDVVLILTVIVSCSYSSHTKKIPDYIKLCKRDDPKIAECWNRAFYALIPRLKNGVPEMGLAPLDPFAVDKISLDIGNSGNVFFHAYLKNVSLFGLTSVIIESHTLDIQKLAFTLDFKIPEIYLTSDCRGVGKILLFEFDGAGRMDLNLTNALLKSSGDGVIIIKDGKEHVKWTLNFLDINVEKMHMNLEDIFPNMEINAAANQAFNANDDVVFKEIKPIILETIKTIYIGIVNNVYNSFSFDVLYPK